VAVSRPGPRPRPRPGRASARPGRSRAEAARDNTIAAVSFIFLNPWLGSLRFLEPRPRRHTAGTGTAAICITAPAAPPAPRRRAPSPNAPRRPGRERHASRTSRWRSRSRPRPAGLDNVPSASPAAGRVVPGQPLQSHRRIAARYRSGSRASSRRAAVSSRKDQCRRNGCPAIGQRRFARPLRPAKTRTFRAVRTATPYSHGPDRRPGRMSFARPAVRERAWNASSASARRPASRQHAHTTGPNRRTSSANAARRGAPETRRAGSRRRTGVVRNGVQVTSTWRIAPAHRFDSRGGLYSILPVDSPRVHQFFRVEPKTGPRRMPFTHPGVSYEPPAHFNRHAARRRTVSAADDKAVAFSTALTSPAGKCGASPNQQVKIGTPRSTPTTRRSSTSRRKSPATW